MPGFCGTMVTATGVVTTTLPWLWTDRTNAFTLVVSLTSQGTCAVIWVGETENSGARMPLKYTSVPARWLGNLFGVVSAYAFPVERLVPMIDTTVPAATLAASPPPLRLELAVLTAICEALLAEEGAAEAK